MIVRVVSGDRDLRHLVKNVKRGLCIGMVPVHENKVNSLMKIEKSQLDMIIRVINVNCLFNYQHDATMKKIRNSSNGLYYRIVVDCNGIW